MTHGLYQEVVLSVGAATVVVVVGNVVVVAVVVDNRISLSCLRRRSRASRSLLRRAWRSAAAVLVVVVELWLTVTRLLPPPRTTCVCCCVLPPWLSRRIGLLPFMAMICGHKNKVMKTSTKFQMSSSSVVKCCKSGNLEDFHLVLFGDTYGGKGELHRNSVAYWR